MEIRDKGIDLIPVNICLEVYIIICLLGYMYNEEIL